MARSGRGLGNRPLGGNSSAPNRGPQGATGGGSLGGGGGMTAAHRRGPNRPNNRPNNRRSGRGGGDPTGITDPENTGISNTLDQDTTTNAFNDMDNYRQGAWGMLNRAGVNQAGMNDAERSFAENRINDWIDQYQGSGLTGDSSVTFEDWMYGHGGQPGDALGAPPATEPVTPQTRREWMANQPGLGINRNQWRDMNAGRRGRIKDRYQGYLDSQAQLTPEGGVGSVISPGTEAWRNTTFYPSMGASYQKDWAAATNEQRGYDSRAWRAAGRVMPY